MNETETEQKETKPIKQQIREPNYIYELALVDKQLFKSQQNGFQLGFSVGFHILQKLRQEYGNPRVMNVMADLVKNLTNQTFISAYIDLDIEVLDFFWFNSSELTQEWYKLVVERINLLLASKSN